MNIYAVLQLQFLRGPLEAQHSRRYGLGPCDGTVTVEYANAQEGN